MPVKIIRGGIGSEKSGIFIDEIRQTHEKNPRHRCIMLVPDHYSFETEKTFVKVFGGTGLNNIDVMTPRKMAVTFLPAKDLKYLAASGRQMLVSRAVSEYCAEEEDSPLIRTMKTSGFTRVMEALIEEMKRYCVTAEMLLKSAEVTESEALKNKLSAAAHIYEKYSKFFDDGQYTDSNDDLTRVAEYIRSSDIFNENLHIWIDRFDEFYPQHMEILRALADKNADITIGLNYPENDSTGTYMCMAETYEKVKLLNGYTGDIVCGEPLMHVNSEEIKFMLANYNNLKAEWTEEVNDISLFAGRDAYGEIEHTAGEILRLVREEGYRYRDIVVMCGDSSSVSHIIKAVFDEYGIPYFSDEKITLSDHPIAMQLLSVFDMFDEDWSYNSVMRYLRAGFIYEKDGTRIDQSEIDRIDNFALKYGVRGRKRWLEDKWINEPDTFERVWNEEEHEPDSEEEAVNKIKDIVMQPLAELCKKVKSGKTAQDYANAVFEFLDGIHMYSGLKNDVTAFENDGKQDEAQQFSEIWNLILEVLDQTVVTMGERKLSFSEYGKYIKAGLSSCEIRTIPSCLDSVCVGSVERSTAAPVKALFVTGAVSGTYPSEIVDEGFLSNSDRGILKEQCGVALAPDTKRRMSLQYFKVYKAIAPVTDKLFLSYSVQNSGGEALRPSRLIFDIQRIFKSLKTKDNIITDFADKSYISSPDATLHKLLINRSGGGSDLKSIEWETVYRWFKESGRYNNKLELLKKASEFGNKNASLSRRAARTLFGSGESTYSASRLNTYAQCPFSYFMQYGLNAKEQEASGIAANDFGTYAHSFIQEFCSRVEDGAETPEKKAEKWKSLTDAERGRCIDSITDETKEKIKELHPYDEAKRLNMVDRIAKTVKGSAEIVHKSLKRGRYTTDGFEREFDKIPIGDGIYIKGAVDRIDTYTDGDSEYIRIIDYKTGHTGFDILDIYNGVNMQMVIYALAVQKIEEEAKNRKTELSGMFYNKVRDSFVRCDSGNADNAHEEHIKNMCLDGVIFAPQNSDGSIDMESIYAVDGDAREHFEIHDSYKSDFAPVGLYKNGNLSGSVHTDKERDALMKYVADSIKGIDREIKDGHIPVYPYKESSQSDACTWCAFKEACVFERENADMRKKNGSKKEAWNKIAEKYKEDSEQ